MSIQIDLYKKQQIIDNMILYLQNVCNFPDVNYSNNRIEFYSLNKKIDDKYIREAFPDEENITYLENIAGWQVATYKERNIEELSKKIKLLERQLKEQQEQEEREKLIKMRQEDSNYDDEYDDDYDELET
jgi:hypothetical protein